MEGAGDVEALAVVLALEKHHVGTIRLELGDRLTHQGASDPCSAQHRIDDDTADPGVAVVVGMRCLYVDVELPLEDL